MPAHGFAYIIRANTLVWEVTRRWEAGERVRISGRAVPLSEAPVKATKEVTREVGGRKQPLRIPPHSGAKTLRVTVTRPPLSISVCIHALWNLCVTTPPGFAGVV